MNPHFLVIFISGKLLSKILVLLDFQKIGTLNASQINVYSSNTAINISPLINVIVCEYAFMTHISFYNEIKNLSKKRMLSYL